MASCVPIGIRGDQQWALLFLELQSKDKTAASTNSIEALAYSHQDPFQPLFGMKCAIKLTFHFYLNTLSRLLWAFSRISRQTKV